MKLLSFLCGFCETLAIRFFTRDYPIEDRAAGEYGSPYVSSDPDSL